MTIIGASLVITGDITSREDVTVHGAVKGRIAMQDGTLLVAPGATVEADVQGIRLAVHGTLSGGIAAAERVELAATATVRGTLAAPAVVMHEGAQFNGSIEVSRRTQASARAPNTPAPAAV